MGIIGDFFEDNAELSTVILRIGLGLTLFWLALSRFFNPNSVTETINQFPFILKIFPAIWFVYIVAFLYLILCIPLFFGWRMRFFSLTITMTLLIKIIALFTLQTIWYDNTLSSFPTLSILGENMIQCLTMLAASLALAFKSYN